MATMSPKTYEPIYFDDLGDLTLEVGTPPVSCVVCSRTLARNSRVFRAMLFGPWREARPREGKWVVALPEDDIGALEIILNAMHAPFDKVPTTLGKPDQTSSTESRQQTQETQQIAEEALYQVLKLADLYDCMPVLQLCLHRWYGEVDKSRIPRSWLGRRLWIGWLLGDQEMLSEELGALVTSSFLEPVPGDDPGDGNEADAVVHEQLAAYDARGDKVLLDLQEKHEDQIIGYLDLSDRIEERRMELISSMLEMARKLLDKKAIVDYQRCFCHWFVADFYTAESKAKHARRISNYRQEQGGRFLHHMKLSLGEAGLWPFPTPETFKGSATQLLDQLHEAQTIFLARAKGCEPFCARCSSNPSREVRLRPMVQISSLHAQVYRAPIKYLDWASKDLRTPLLEFTDWEKCRMEENQKRAGLQPGPRYV